VVEVVESWVAEVGERQEGEGGETWGKGVGCSTGCISLDRTGMSGNEGSWTLRQLAL
jgi:hypothetical protein